MAVTLQLARITPARLSECRRSVAVLDRLCSFEFLSAADYLDLGWVNDALIRLCEHATAVRRAVTGDTEVNPASRPALHRDGAAAALEPGDVAALAAALRGIDLDQALARLPSHPQAMKEAIGGILTEFIGDPATTSPTTSARSATSTRPPQVATRRS